MSLLWTFLMNGTLGLGAYWAARHGFRQPPGLARFLAAVILAWAWITLGMEVFGSLGWLSRGPLALLSLSGMLFGLALRVMDRRGADPASAESGGRSVEGEAVVALGLILWASASLAIPSLWGPVKVVSDGPIYHLYFAARWWKAGRLFLVASPFGENAATYFPAVGDLWFTWLLAGWGGDRLAKIGQAPFLVVSALAAYGLARRLGSGRSSALVATSWFVGSSPLLLFSFEPNVDTIFVAGYLLTAYFFLQYALGDGRPGSLALGALAAGGALGTKATGIVFVPILLALALVAALRRRGLGSRTVWHVALLFTLPAVMAGYWYGRNAVLTGNPLYPLHLEVRGKVWLAGWYGSDVMRLSQYYLPRDHWRALIDILLSVLDPRLTPVWAISAAGAWALAGARTATRRWVWACSALAVLNVALYWFVIPYRTQQRFMFHALGLAVVPLALTFDRGRAIRLAAVGLLALHLVTPQEWPFSPVGTAPPWDLFAGVPNAVSAPLTVPLSWDQLHILRARPEAWAPALNTLVTGLAAFGVAWVWGRTFRKTTAGSRLRALAATTVLGGLAIALSMPRNIDPRRLFYPNFRDYVAGWIQLELRAGPAGSRVAYAGTNLPYYLMGMGLRNDVGYVNVDAHRRWLLHDYHRAAGAEGGATWPHPRPGWDRLHPDYDSWLANLREEKVRILVVARANPAEGPHNIIDSSWFPIERAWAEMYPDAFEPIYGVAENDPLFRLYRVRYPPYRAPEGGAEPRP